MKRNITRLVSTLSFIFATIVVSAQCLIVTCAADLTDTLSSGNCDKNITYTLPGGYDMCSEDSITFNYSGLIDRFEVPAGINSITISAWGASGGNSTWSTVQLGGLGAYMSGTFSVTPGQVLHLIVGQQGESAAVGGGGGGAFIVDSASQLPLLIAGGGGGASSDMAGINAVTTQNGTMDALSIIAGGTGGNGGLACITLDNNNGGGGGGFYTNGADANSNSGTSNGGFGGYAFLNGGAGGAPGRLDGACTQDAYGGFGGGGSTSCNTVGGAGGGGYSGGAGGLHISNCGASTRSGGGGGGSFNSGSSQNNQAGVNTGNGMIRINYYSTTGVTTTLLSGLGSGSNYPIGTTTDVYLVALGTESDTCTVNITIVDTISPQFDMVLGDTTFCGSPSGISAPSVSDNCANTISYTLTGATSAAGTGDAGQEAFNLGTTLVDYLVTDEYGNSDNFSFSVTVNAIPVLVVQGDTMVCDELGTIGLSASPSGGSWSGNGVTGSTFDPSVAGIGTSLLTYSFTSAEGCTETASTNIDVFSCASVNQIAQNLIRIYPNPAVDALHIQFDQSLSNASLAIYDVNGRKMIEKDCSNLNSMDVDVNSFSSGVFIMKISSDKGEQYTKFIKK